jgi:hypothetical protein
MRRLLAALILATAACAAGSPPGPRATERDGVTELQGPSSPASADDESPGPPATPILLSADLARACQVTLPEDASTPAFPPDRVDLLPADRSLLRRLAICLTSGPLEKARLLFVLGGPGIGPDRPLSLRRAGNAGAYLEQLGVDRDRIEATYGYDRDEARVELRRGR